MKSKTNDSSNSSCVESSDLEKCKGNILLPILYPKRHQVLKNIFDLSEVKVAACFQSVLGISTATTRHDVTASRVDSMLSKLREAPSSYKNISCSSSKTETAHSLKASLTSLLRWLLHTFLVFLALSLSPVTRYLMLPLECS